MTPTRRDRDRNRPRADLASVKRRVLDGLARAEGGRLSRTQLHRLFRGGEAPAGLLDRALAELAAEGRVTVRETRTWRQVPYRSTIIGVADAAPPDPETGTETDTDTKGGKPR